SSPFEDGLWFRIWLRPRRTTANEKRNAGGRQVTPRLLSRLWSPARLSMPPPPASAQRSLPSRPGVARVDRDDQAPVPLDRRSFERSPTAPSRHAARRGRSPLRPHLDPPACHGHPHCLAGTEGPRVAVSDLGGER